MPYLKFIFKVNPQCQSKKQAQKPTKGIKKRKSSVVEDVKHSEMKRKKVPNTELESRFNQFLQ